METDFVIPQDAKIRYIQRRKADIALLRAALGENSYEEFKRVGHQLKGNASSFGYSDLERIAIMLEAAGDKHDRQEAAQQLDLLERWYDAASKQCS